MLIGAVLYRIIDVAKRIAFNDYIHELMYDTFKVDSPLSPNNFLIIRPNRTSGVIITNSFLNV